MSCNTHLFVRFTLTTLIGTWWGIIGVQPISGVSVTHSALLWKVLSLSAQRCQRIFDAAIWRGRASGSNRKGPEIRALNIRISFHLKSNNFFVSTYEPTWRRQK